MTFETTNFCLKLGKKAGVHYVALQNKKTLETLVQEFRTKKKAEQVYLKMIEKPKQKEDEKETGKEGGKAKTKAADKKKVHR